MEYSELYSNYQTEVWILVNALIAAVLGGAIGFERELKGRPAGMRTHLLVAISASLFMNLAQVLGQTAAALASENSVNFDPSRALVAIVTGISFLGAGTIFRSKDGVSGLTTAATLLFAAAIGTTAALEKYLLASVLTALVVGLLRLLDIAERHLD